MGALLLAIAFTAAVGAPLVRQRGMARAALAFLYGAGVVHAVLLLESLLHIRWTRATTILPLAVIGAAGWLLQWRRRAPDDGGHLEVPRLSWADLATLYILICYALYATAGPLWQWDFWAIWGLKARVFSLGGGIDWNFLRSPWNDFAHLDYPLLVSLNYAFAAIMNGEFSDRWLGIYNVAFGVSLLLLVRAMAAREVKRRWAAALIALAVSGFALSWFIGLAEGALIACGGAAVLCIRRAMMENDDRAMLDGAILLGLAASCKNEGLALIAAVAAALFLVDRKRILKLWPAIAVAGPWLVVRVAYHLTTDIVRGSFVSRLSERAADLSRLALDLLVYMPDLWLWLALFIALLVIPVAERKRERFVLYAMALQFAAYLAVYLGTPWDLDWHVGTSWPRLTRQLGVPLAYVVMIALARIWWRGEESPHAEARLEHQ